MRVIDNVEVLKLFADTITEYLEKKPDHDFGFCWWMNGHRKADAKFYDISRSTQWHSSTGEEVEEPVYSMMEWAIDVYCEKCGIPRMEYLSTRPGYNGVRAHHLALIRDMVFIERIKELS